MGRRIRANRSAAWTAWRYDRFEGRVRHVDRHFTAGHWRVVVRQRWRRLEIWFPGTAAGLADAERQRRLAEALR